MATRSTIAIEHQNGTVSQVYCHWDGYLETNGIILFEQYQDTDKLEQLIALGDLSVLGSDLDSCVFYARDRGETGTNARVFSNFRDYVKNRQSEEFDYIFRNSGEWFVSEDSKSFRLLGDTEVVNSVIALGGI